MACGCGGTAAAPEEFEVILPDQTRKTTTSEVQARQWIARYGGGVIKKLSKA